MPEHDSLQPSAAPVRTWAREFHTLIRLAHPRIVEVYDCGVDEHGPYYMVERLDGGDLQSLMPSSSSSARGCAFPLHT